jgi:hypothetical protein
LKQKGAAIRGTLQALATVHGDRALDAVKAALRPEIRRQIEPVILATSWYPIEVSAAVHLAIRDVVGKGSWIVSHELGVEAGRVDFTGIYRAFVQSINYGDIWSRSQRAWDHYNSQGRVQWYAQERGEAHGQIDGVTGFNDGMWNSVAGRAQMLLTLVGSRSASVSASLTTPNGCHIQALWFE